MLIPIWGSYISTPREHFISWMLSFYYLHFSFSPVFIWPCKLSGSKKENWTKCVTISFLKPSRYFYRKKKKILKPQFCIVFLDLARMNQLPFLTELEKMQQYQRLLGNLCEFMTVAQEWFWKFLQDKLQREKLCNENCSLAKCNYPPNVVINLKIKTVY